jgi:Raf kinase inhibitor-like YbhB/YbcL family protein
MALTLTSNDFKEGDMLGQQHVLSEAYGFGCAGGNLSPHLAWSGAPAGTQSFAVTCFDPDAPTGSGFWHWVVVNIPPDVTALPLGAGDPARGTMPAGALEVRTDFGKPGYGGPCSPPGSNVHRYLFTLHAVDMKALPVTADTSAAVVGFYLNFHAIEKATLIGLFRR